ncbi:hypothetical protein MK079_04515 [Candidatus Gracilibacteria bacterium]|nr:hypothetical protein [Candidatus Gracilibacteria bacterium]
MLFHFFKKQKETEERKKLLTVSLLSMNIPEKQKNLYVEALKIANNEDIDVLFKNITHFVENIEMKKIEDIHKKSFSEVAGMRKKEAEEKTKEINSFSFLISNI